MRRISIIILFSLFIFHSSFSWAQTVSDIKPVPGEKWWGLFAGNSVPQPFSTPFEINTAELNGSGFYTSHMVSSAGRYVRSGEDFEVAFNGTKLSITSDAGYVDPQKGGRTLRQAYLAMHHRDFNGTDRFPSPELFSNLVYETEADFGFRQTADDILAYAGRLLDEGFPPGIMVLSDGWRNAPGYAFDERYYPDPAGFIGEMHRMGFKVMLTVTPYIQAWGREYAALERERGLVADPGGSPFVMGGSDGFFVAVDLTVPEQLYRLKASLSELQEKCDVDGFRFDCLDVIDEISADAEYARNYLGAVRAIGAEFALSEFVPGVPEFQADYASAIRTSKNNETGYLMDMMTTGIAAGPFTQVLPGVDALENGSEKGFVRYALMQAMMPVARVPFMPWKYAFAAEELQRVLVFRASFSKYTAKMFDEVAKSIEPIIRPMEYNFPNSGFADCAEQYMIGDKYLVAPALDDSPKRMVRLPRGTWRDMNGRKYKGPVVFEAETDGYKMTWFELQ